MPIILENCRYIDVSELTKESRFGPEDLIAQGLRLPLEDDEGGEYYQDIYFAQTRLHFGYRTFFLCECGRKAQRLYLPPGGRYYMCSRSYRLIYASQAQKGDPFYEFYHKHMHKLEKLEKKLNKKGVHWKTRIKLLEEIDAINKRLDAGVELLKMKTGTMKISKLLGGVASFLK